MNLQIDRGSFKGHHLIIKIGVPELEIPVSSVKEPQTLVVNKIPIFPVQQTKLEQNVAQPFNLDVLTPPHVANNLIKVSPSNQSSKHQLAKKHLIRNLSCPTTFCCQRQYANPLRWRDRTPSLEPSIANKTSTTGETIVPGRKNRWQISS